MKYLKLILFILIFICCLIIFKYTKKYKYESVIPINLQQELLYNRNIPNINKPQNINRNYNIYNNSNNIQQNLSKKNIIIDKIPSSSLTERPAIKWIIKQNPLEYS